MPKSVFVSYSHCQADWVLRRLVPCLEAGGCEVLIDRERFEAGKGLIRQMDREQDRAEVTLAVLSDEYLTSPSCRHELERAIAKDPEAKLGTLIPIKRKAVEIPDEIKSSGALRVDLTDDDAEEQWATLMRALGADLGCTPPDWLRALEQSQQGLDHGDSVNLIVRGRGVKWRALIRELHERRRLLDGVIDLQDGATAARSGLIAEILAVCGLRQPVPDPPRDLVAFGHGMRRLAKAARIALTHFDEAVERPEYGRDLFSALRHAMTEDRKLKLLIQSRASFAQLLPAGHPLSSIANLRTVPLRGP